METLVASSNADNPVFRRIASGGHPNILHLRIPLDEKTKKFKTQLTVDEVRRSVGFSAQRRVKLVGASQSLIMRTK